MAQDVKDRTLDRRVRRTEGEGNKGFERVWETLTTVSVLFPLPSYVLNSSTVFFFKPLVLFMIKLHDTKFFTFNYILCSFTRFIDVKFISVLGWTSSY